MHCWLKILVVSAYIVSASVSACLANSDDTKTDQFPYSNLKFFPHWVIGCNNLNECMAVGYPVPIKEAWTDTVIQPWQITAKWQKDSAVISFSFSDFWTSDDYQQSGGNPDDISVTLCESNKQCRKLDSGDKLRISAQKDGSWTQRDTSFILDAAKLNPDSYIIFNESKDEPIYFKELLQNRNSIKINYLPQLGGKEKIYKMVNMNDVSSFSDAELKKIYPQYATDLGYYTAESSPRCPLPNFSVKYGNGDKFLFLCDYGGFNTAVAKYDGKIYKTFNIVDKTTSDVTGILDNEFSNIDFSDDSGTTFESNSDKAGSLTHCGKDYEFAYNGKSFIVEAIRYMPICTNIGVQDWPVVYQRPQ